MNSIGRALKGVAKGSAETAGDFLRGFFRGAGEVFRMGERPIPGEGPSVGLAQAPKLNPTNIVEPYVSETPWEHLENPGQYDLESLGFLDYALRRRISRNLKTGEALLPEELHNEVLSSMKSVHQAIGTPFVENLESLINSFQEPKIPLEMARWDRKKLMRMHQILRDSRKGLERRRWGVVEHGVTHPYDVNPEWVAGLTKLNEIEDDLIKMQLDIGVDPQRAIDLRAKLDAVRPLLPSTMHRGLEGVKAILDNMVNSLYKPKKGVKGVELANLKALLQQYKDFPDELTAYSIMKRAKDQMEEIVANGGSLSDYITIPDLGRVQIDPVQREVFKASVQDLLSAHVTGMSIPAMQQFLKVSDLIRQPGDDFTLRETEEGKLLSAYITTDRSFAESLQTLFSNLGHRITTDGVFGAAMSAFGDMVYGMNAGGILARKLEDAIRERLKNAFPEIETREELMAKLADAMESGNRQALRKFLEDHPEMANTLDEWLSIQALMERYKLMTPQLKNSFVENYVMHRYPELLRFIQRGSTGSLGEASDKLFSEFRRTIPTLEEARIRSQRATRFLSRLGITPDEFIYGGGRVGAATRKARAMATNLTEEQADELLTDLLLANPVTDIPTLIREQVHSVFRASSVRQALDILRVTTGPEGLPLLALSPEVRTAKARSRPSPGTKITYEDKEENRLAVLKSYVQLDSIPGFKWMEIEGKDSSAWYVHPQAAEFLRQYMTYKPNAPGAMQTLATLWAAVRALGLMGSPLSYFWSIMSNVSLVSGDMMQAAAMPHLGERLRLERSDLLLDMIRSGLQPQTLLRFVKEVPENLFNELEPEVLQTIYGTAGPKAEGVSKLVNMIENGVLKPIEGVLGADATVNRYTLFQTIMDSMIGAWSYHLRSLWEKKGPELISAHGGNVLAAWTEAKRGAAEIVNQLANSVPSHMQSDALRKALYTVFSTPQVTGSRIRMVMSVMDNVVRRAKGRSIFSHWDHDPVMQQIVKDQMEKVLWGGLIAGTLSTTLLSYMINGRSQFTNPPEKIMHLWLDTDEYGTDTYLINPFFGTFRPFLRALIGSAEEGSLEQALQSIQGLLNPGWRLMIDTITGTDYLGRPITRGGISPQTAMDYAKHMVYSILSTEELLGMSSHPVKGHDIPMTDQLMALLGAQVSHINPELRLSHKMERRAKFYDLALKGMVEELMLQARAKGLDTEEGAELVQKAVKLAYQDGIPITDPELAKIYKNATGRPNYVFTSPDTMRALFTKHLAPLATALKSTPKIAQPELLEQIEEYHTRSEKDFLGRLPHPRRRRE